MLFRSGFSIGAPCKRVARCARDDGVGIALHDPRNSKPRATAHHPGKVPRPWAFRHRSSETGRIRVALACSILCRRISHWAGLTRLAANDLGAATVFGVVRGKMCPRGHALGDPVHVHAARVGRP